MTNHENKYLVMEKKYTVGAVLFENFELLDYYGPLQMLGKLKMRGVLDIVSLAKKAGRVGTKVAPGHADFSFEDAPPLDMLLISGGSGTKDMRHDARFMEWLRQQAEAATTVAAVCTGSILLSHTGILNGKRATTAKTVWERTHETQDRVHWVRAARWVVDGKFYTSSGVSAGIDMTLGIIQDLWGEEVRKGICDKTEYIWHEDRAQDPFTHLIDA